MPLVTFTKDLWSLSLYRGRGLSVWALLGVWKTGVRGVENLAGWIQNFCDPI